jgi:sulfur-carrier protein adenylyltransferase/sulfurtransferase
MFDEVYPEEVKARLDAGEDLVIVDVRQPEEHAEKNIPSAILIPLNTLPERIDELAPYKDREIIVYCKAGGRSARACEYMVESGFAKPVNLIGGMMAW